MNGRSRTRVFGVVLPLAAIAALAACAEEEPPPVASPGGAASQGAAAQQSSSPPSAGESASVRSSAVPESAVEVSSGLVLPRRLSTTAAVEKRDLPAGISSSQVREMRSAWNARGGQLARMRSGKEDKLCAARADKIWVGAFRTDAGRLLVGMGPLDPDGKPRCTVDGASVLVDSSTREVLGRGRVALLL